MGEGKYRDRYRNESLVEGQSPGSAGMATPSSADTTNQKIPPVNYSAPVIASYSQSDLRRLRSLPKADNILLLTPVLPPPPDWPSAKLQPPMDPFEPFGRTMSKYHKRIRHVPYVLEGGMTPTHLEFIRCADVVICAFCPGEAPEYDAQLQRTFVEAVQEALIDLEDSEFMADTEEPEIPMILLQIQPDISTAMQNTISGIPTVVASPSYSPSALQIAGEILFGHHGRVVHNPHEPSVTCSYCAPPA